jgi:O-antigen biosynthesis protein
VARPAPYRQKRSSLARDAAAAVLNQVRRLSWLHGPVHAVAVQLAKLPLGARMIRSVLEPQYPSTLDYVAWVEQHDTLTDQDRAEIRAHIEDFAHRPTISVIMPVYETDPRFLAEAINAVRNQLYPNWELCIADDASPSPKIWAALQAAATSDPRIKILRRPGNGHISAASNSALTLATGDFVALMDHDDLLPEHALYEVAAELQAHPDADLIYSDEDKIDDQGRRFEPHFKTGWNPELLLSQNMVSHLGVYRKALVDQVGGFRDGLEGSQDYDLTLRVSELTRPDRIRHIPAVLYHWRQQAGPGSFSETDQERCGRAAQRAVQEHLVRTGQSGATVERLPEAPTWLRVRRQVPNPAPLVSVIVPTRDRADLLARCLEGVLQRTDYPNLELIVVDNDSVKPQTRLVFDAATQDPRVRIIASPGPFNYSKINNQAVAEARGDILLFLNNDVEVLSPDWLSEMVTHAVRPGIGAVGARLLLSDGRIQHGGVILGVGGEPPVAGNLYAGAPADDPGYYNHLSLSRNMSAVTAACLAMPKVVFEQAGGFDEEHLAVAFNDVDLCLKVIALGYQIIWTPFAELSHLESASRGSDLQPENQKRFQREIAIMRERWGTVLDNDPFYGPNFDHRRGDYRLASPPRRVKPWRRATKP